MKRGEPDPYLFAVPDDCREVGPSEFERTLLLGMVEEREGFEGGTQKFDPPGPRKAFLLYRPEMGHRQARPPLNACAAPTIRPGPRR